MDRKRWMQQAMDLAAENVSRHRGEPFGAVIVREGEVIATGVNETGKIQDPTAHAEIQAIREACRKLGKTVLDDCEMFASGEPCSMCMGAIQWAGFRAVWFAAAMEESERLGLKPAKGADMIPVQKLEMKDREKHPFRLWERLQQQE
ncbi:nucleoside deaminase [Kroppenstedtia eburnea]|uniref:nucleoside deaminase n=1 Tax=Kroppenstedtia eburnea TaxID=714067 RepID=UPI00362BBC81